jgi:hypothetical protein
MSLLALNLGDRPVFTWQGTFAAVLLPATVVGALIGLAVHSAETSERERWRWVLLSPFLLLLGPAIVQPDFFGVLLTTGMGGGAIGVALVGALGGFALSGFGAKWVRGVSGLFAMLFALASIAPAYIANRSPDLPPSAGEVFGVTLFLLLMAVLVGGITAPARARSRRRPPSAPPPLAA